MVMSERSLRLSRRKFLLTVGAGSAATAAAVVAVRGTNAPTSPASKKDKRATRGYHATEHVNNYYRTAKV
jgi:nitrous oxide reductase